MFKEYFDDYPYYQIKPKYYVACDKCGEDCGDVASDDKEEMNEFAEYLHWKVDAKNEKHYCPKCGGKK